MYTFQKHKGHKHAPTVAHPCYLDLYVYGATVYLEAAPYDDMLKSWNPLYYLLLAAMVS